MSNPLIRKLEVAVALTDDDRAALERTCSRTRLVEANHDVTCEGDRPENVHLVLEGWACRYKLMPEGKRQVMAILLPGDYCDLHVAILGERDHSIATLSPCVMVEIPRATILELIENHPRINHALLWSTLVDEAILREWLANMGQRPSDKRLAHFFCELLIRLQMVGLASENEYAMPIRQTDLADIFGLTSVHVNRTLQDLRAAGLIVLKERRIEICDVRRLKAFCDFNDNYLHLTKRRSD